MYRKCVTKKGFEEKILNFAKKLKGLEKTKMKYSVEIHIIKRQIFYTFIMAVNIKLNKS